MVALSACTANRQYDNAAISRQALATLSPESLRSNLSLSQLVRGELLGEGQSVRFELDIAGDRLVLIGLTHTGVPLFSLTQTGHRYNFKTSIPQNAAFAPEFLLADIKLAYWPIETLNLAIGSLRSRVVEIEKEGRRRRTLKDENGQSVVEVFYPVGNPSSGTLVVRHYDIPYVLRIETLASRGEDER